MIIVDIEDGVARVTLNRPERRNALGTALVERMDDVLTELEADVRVRVLILNGAPPCFCGGSDLKELSGLTPAEMCAHEAPTALLVRKIGCLTCPVIAAVEGAALGGGMALALGCDLVVSASDAKWRMPEVSLGWLPPWGLQSLVTRVGPVRAREITWGARSLNGVEARALGLVDYVAEPGRAAVRALELATELAKLPAHAVASTKAFYAGHFCGNAESLDVAARRVFESDCQSEAAKTTLERFGGKK